ncbi:unnamed protein product [Linum tenue]|uniref:DUF4228 domain protein n=2 Tax=Linum tenue TaxID=586396 RepID=A0AAV0R9N3_9ROSI|nr:unnamed protein product [Linum tenue]
MGNCRSCDSTRVGGGASTAKLILQDGRLQEFSYPVKASFVLRMIDTHAPHFICNADEMEFDDSVLAVDDDEELQPGQLYFALPVAWLRRPLQPEEMAALAVKASSALMKTSAGGGGIEFEKSGCRSDVGKCRRRGSAPPAAAAGGRRSRRRGSSSGSEKKFAAMLSAIPE